MLLLVIRSRTRSLRRQLYTYPTIDNRRNLNLTLPKKKKKKDVTMIRCERIFGVIKFSSTRSAAKESFVRKNASKHFKRVTRARYKISYEINVIPSWVHIPAVFAALISVAVSAFLPRFKSGRLKREDSPRDGGNTPAHGREMRREILPLAILRVMLVCMCVSVKNLVSLKTKAPPPPLPPSFIPGENRAATLAK